MRTSSWIIRVCLVVIALGFCMGQEVTCTGPTPSTSPTPTPTPIPTATPLATPTLTPCTQDAITDGDMEYVDTTYWPLTDIINANFTEKTDTQFQGGSQSLTCIAVMLITPASRITPPNMDSINTRARYPPS